MRCPDCSKFVSMENQDPEVNDINADINGDSIDITADGRSIRACADCGTELKDLSWDMETEIHLDQFEGFAALSKEDQQALRTAMDEGDESVSVEVQDEGAEMNEGGGSRFQKNMIATTLSFEVTLTWTREGKEDVVLTKSGNMESENAASEFEECC